MTICIQLLLHDINWYICTCMYALNLFNNYVILNCACFAHDHFLLLTLASPAPPPPTPHTHAHTPTYGPKARGWTFPTGNLEATRSSLATTLDSPQTDRASRACYGTQWYVMWFGNVKWYMYLIGYQSHDWQHQQEKTWHTMTSYEQRGACRAQNNRTAFRYWELMNMYSSRFMVFSSSHVWNH